MKSIRWHFFSGHLVDRLQRKLQCPAVTPCYYNALQYTTVGRLCTWYSCGGILEVSMLWSWHHKAKSWVIIGSSWATAVTPLECRRCDCAGTAWTWRRQSSTWLSRCSSRWATLNERRCCVARRRLIGTTRTSTRRCWTTSRRGTLTRSSSVCRTTTFCKSQIPLR